MSANKLLCWAIAGVSGGRLTQLTVSVNATWLAALPGDANSPSQPVLLGPTQGTANSTGYISIADVVLQGAAGIDNLSLTLLNHPEVHISL